MISVLNTTTNKMIPDPADVVDYLHDTFQKQARPASGIPKSKPIADTRHTHGRMFQATTWDTFTLKALHTAKCPCCNTYNTLTSSRDESHK